MILKLTQNCAYSVINDRCGDDEKIQILARRILDSVIINLQGHGCVLSLTPPFEEPKTSLKGRTTEQLCKIASYEAIPCGEYFTFSGEATAMGKCNYTCQDGEAEADCVITLPFECLLRLPEPSVLMPELSIIASFNFEAAEALSTDCYCASASGAAIAMLCSYVPITVKADTYRPQCADARSDAREKQPLLDLFPH